MTTSRFSLIDRRRLLSSSLAGCTAILTARQAVYAGPRASEPAGLLAQDSSLDVPMFRGNAARTGEMPGPAPSLDKPIVVKWRFATGDNIWSSPIVVDSTVYFGCFDHHIYAVDAATGVERWRFPTGWVIYGSPAVMDGTVFVGSGDGNLYAIDASSGNERWRFAPGYGIDSSPVVANGTVFFGCGESEIAGPGEGLLFAINAASGEERWRFLTSDGISSDAAVDGDTVVISCYDGNLYAVNTSTGNERWRTNTGHGTWGSPVIAGGMVFIYDHNGRFYAVDMSTGEERWSAVLGADAVRPSPAVVDNTIFVGGCGYDGYGGYDVNAIDAASGEILWSFPTGHPVQSSPGVVDGTVFIGSNDQNLYAIDAASGLERWQFSTGDFVLSSPTVIDGAVFVGGEDGYLYALGNLLPTVLITDVILLAAPSPNAIERGTAKNGDTIDHVGSFEERDGARWVEVTIGTTGGWIPLDAIDSATLPPEGDIEYVYIP